MSTAAQTAGDELVDIEVAPGHTVIVNGERRQAGETAAIAASEVASLMAAGFVVNPDNKPAEQTARHSAEAQRVAWNVFTTMQAAMAVACGLRPNQKDGLLRAEHFVRQVDAIRAQAEQLVQALRNSAPTPTPRAP